MLRRSSLAMALACCLLTGCTSTAYKELQQDAVAWELLHQHMLNVTEDGDVDPHHAPTKAAALSLQPWSETTCRNDDLTSESNQRIARSVDNIMFHFDKWATKQPRKQRPRVLLVLHGGLVSQETGTVEAQALLTAMRGADFYPIFVNWEAGIGASYFDHLLRVRNGERVGRTQGWLTAPFVGFADFGRALGRTPVFLYEQLRYTFGGQRKKGRFTKASKTELRCPQNGTDCDNRIPANWDQSVYLPPLSDPKAPLDLRWFVPGAARLVTTPLADFAGTGAYQNMLRRSRLMFLQDEDFGQLRHRPCGALGRLMRELRAYELTQLKKLNPDDPLDRNRGNDRITQLRALQVLRRAMNRDEGESYERKIEDLKKQLVDDQTVLPITIISHSMGAVIANELIHRNPDLYYDNVVYMAAASTVKDFAALALPYLEANPATRFYNLTLHPFNEVREAQWHYTVPEGSLLTWIDRFLTDPKSPLDRTLGTWNNLAESLSIVQHVEAETRNRFQVRVFELKDKNNVTPRQHGDFNDPPAPCSKQACEDNTCDAKSCKIRNKMTKAGYLGNEFWNKAFWQSPHKGSAQQSGDSATGPPTPP